MLDELTRAVQEITFEIATIHDTAALGKLPGYPVAQPATSLDELSALKAKHSGVFDQLAASAQSITSMDAHRAFLHRLATAKVNLRKVLPLPTASAERRIDAALLALASDISKRAGAK